MISKPIVLALALMAFTAHWKAHWWTVAACPEQEHQVNPYTGERPPTISVEAVACAEEHMRVMYRDFETKDDADAFLAKCPDSNFITGPDAVICTDKSVTESNPDSVSPFRSDE